MDRQKIPLLFTKQAIPYWIGLACFPFLLFLLLNIVFPLKSSVAYSQIILAKDSTVLHAFLTKEDKWRLKTELPEIIPALRKTLIYKEDKYFYYHPGINLIAIGRAFINNIIYFKNTSGASTITMQVARLLEPKRRNYINKFVEMFRALQLEWRYSKEEILQMYVNLVPYGGNIEGVKSASLLYFDRMPDKLSLAQIVTLTIIPNRPTSLVIGENNSLIEKERNKWLHRFERDRVFSKKQIKNALTEVLDAQRLPAPAHAPHFCHRLRRMHSEVSPLYTSLDKQMHEKVQQLTFNYVRRLHGLGIHNASVLIVNNRTQEVEVYVGSSDFEDKFHAGEVDGIQGIRSPGSTLKPLVYALAMDKGVLTPKTMLADVPRKFSGFSPENFYKRFSGSVTVEEALAQSLNVTAVKTLENIGLNSFLNTLKKADFHQVRKDEKKLGLSTVLGGCGVTLEELVGLYTSLGNRGLYRPLRYLKTDTMPTDGQRLVSPESAFAITEILTKAQRPDLSAGFENTYRIPKIAWKTGTSYGRRDAWSIGYNAHYTIGVWVGNFDGEGVNNLIGAEVATPLLFEIFNTIDYNDHTAWFKAPKGLKVRWVCSETGLPPNHFCKNQVVDYYIPLISSPEKCQHLKEFFVSEDEKTSYCLTCLPATGYKKKYYPNYPSEILAFWEAQGIAYDKIPPHSESCTRLYEEDKEAPVITSPSADKEYIIDRHDPPQMQLRCQTHNDVKKVYWYINEEFYKEATAGEDVFFTPAQGMVKIACSDDKGRHTQLFIRVLYE